METARTQLTLLTKKDFPDVLKMFQDPKTTVYIKHLQNLTTAEYETILNNRLAQLENKIGYHWTVRLKNSYDFVGALNLSPIRNTEMMQIGFQLATKYWNKGFASELAKMVLEFGVHHAGLKTIYGVFEKENVGSRKVLERLGFSLDKKGVLKEKGVEVYRFGQQVETKN